MNANPTRSLAVGISARSLLDLRAEDEVLRDHGRAAYGRHQHERRDEALPAGPGLPVVRALLAAGGTGERGVEIVVLSDGLADASHRVLSSARHHDLEVARAAFTGGEPMSPYLTALRVDLFLSRDPEEAAAAMDAGVAAALVPPASEGAVRSGLRIAVDGGSVVTGPRGDAAVPRWIAALTGLQRLGGDSEHPVRTALVCSEDAPARERILAALDSWDVRLDQAFFTEANAKADVLAAFRPHVVFDVPRPAADGRLVGDTVAKEESDSSLRSRLRLRA